MQYSNKVVMSDISKIIMMAAVLIFASPGISYGGHFKLAFQRKLPVWSFTTATSPPP